MDKLLHDANNEIANLRTRISSKRDLLNPAG